jgi:hypothetical protein
LEAEIKDSGIRVSVGVRVTALAMKALHPTPFVAESDAERTRLCFGQGSVSIILI